MFLNILNKKTSFNKTVVLNVLGSTILQGIAFITVPIFSRVLGSAQFGLFSIFMSWESIFSTVLALGVNTCISSGKYYFKDEYYSFRYNIIFYNVILALASVIVYILFYFKIRLLVEYNFKIYVVLLLTAFSTNVIGTITSILIFEKKALFNFVISVFLSLSNVVLSLLLIYFVPFDNIYEGRVYGYFLPYFVVVIVIIVYCFSNKPFRIDSKYLKYGLYVGFPIVFHQLSHYVLGQSDRIMMQKMSILDSEIGVYSLFYTFCGVIRIILNAFNTSFSPYYLDYIDTNDKQSMVSKSKNYIELFTIICIGFLLLSREVSYLMGDKEYYGGINLIPIIVCSAYFTFLYQFAVNYEFFYRKTKTIALGTVGAAVLNIILNVYFIGHYGMYGAAYSTLISYGLLFLFHYLIAKSMRDNRFYIGIQHFAYGIVPLIIASYVFYSLAEYIYIRWIIAIVLGIYEGVKIIHRKSIF